MILQPIQNSISNHDGDRIVQWTQYKFGLWYLKHYGRGVANDLKCFNNWMFVIGPINSIFKVPSDFKPTS